jgi:hypothetical protein
MILCKNCQRYTTGQREIANGLCGHCIRLYDIRDRYQRGLIDRTTAGAELQALATEYGREAEIPDRGFVTARLNQFGIELRAVILDRINANPQKFTIPPGMTNGQFATQLATELVNMVRDGRDRSRIENFHRPLAMAVCRRLGIPETLEALMNYLRGNRT